VEAYVPAGHRRIYRDGHALMAEVIGNDQAVDAPAVAQRATDKVQAPYLMTHVAATSGVRSPRYFLPMLRLRTAKPCSRQRRNTFFWLVPGNSP